MNENQLNSRDITFRTVFHDVEGIKAYLRKLRHENERVINNIQTLIHNEVHNAFNSATTLRNIVSEVVNETISPLKTEWVNDEFIDYIGNNLSASTINIISDKFMSIVNYNSEQFNAYINSAITTGAVEAIISPLKTEWIDSSFINYITGFISNSSGNITNDIQQEIANQFPEIDIKNILKDYHLIEKHYTTLTTNVAIDISGLANPATALERFRILAYISGDKATDN